MVRLGISAALAAAIIAGAPAAQADDTLGKVIGAIAQGADRCSRRRIRTRRCGRAARKRNSVAAYQSYLSDHPNGRHAAEARSIITRATGKSPDTSSANTAAARVEAALNLSRSDRSAVQRDLVAMAYDPRGTDGNFGPATRRSIADWQRANGLSSTGYLTRSEIDLLRKQAKGEVQPSGSESTARAELALNLTRAQRMNVQRQLTALGYDAGTPDGLFGRGTRSAIANWQRAARVPVTGYLSAQQIATLNRQAAGKTPSTAQPTANARDGVEEQLLTLSTAERYDVQRRLNALGYGTSGIDGKFGPGTRRAIARWQGDNGVRATGYLQADQLKLLRTQKPAANATQAAQADALARAEASVLPDAASRLLVEQQLVRLGYKGVTADGVFDARTRQAIRAFQQSKGQAQTGYVSQQTLLSMMVR